MEKMNSSGKVEEELGKLQRQLKRADFSHLPPHEQEKINFLRRQVDQHLTTLSKRPPVTFERLKHSDPTTHGMYVRFVGGITSALGRRKLITNVTAKDDASRLHTILMPTGEGKLPLTVVTQGIPSTQQLAALLRSVGKQPAGEVIRRIGAGLSFEPKESELLEMRKLLREHFAHVRGLSQISGETIEQVMRHKGPLSEKLPMLLHDIQLYYTRLPKAQKGIWMFNISRLGK
ncbi:MAG: hypothetical protein ABIG96_06680 [Candidatus Micrarchaeota archaeon]